MYYYILDPTNISSDKFEQKQIELQGLLTEFNISGETARVTTLRTISELVDTASQRGVKTLVACGTDDTFNLMLASLRGRDFVLAYIPFDEEHSYLAKILGVNNLSNAVKTIASRRIEHIDLANTDTNYFISFLELGITATEVKKSGMFSGIRLLSSGTSHLLFRIDDSYNLEVKALTALIVNTRPSSTKDSLIANPTDGYLDLLIMEDFKISEILKYKQAIGAGLLETIPKSTVIRCKKIECLEPKGFPIKLSGKIITKFPTTIHMHPSALRVIVGKTRTF